MATTIATLLIDVQANTSGVSKGLKKLGVGLAALGAAGAAVGKRMLSLAADTEQTIKTFEVFTGSQAKAVELFKELEKFSIVTPFTPEEVTESAKTLLTFGRTADQVGDDLRRLGELAALAGKPIGPLAEAFGKANARVRVTNKTLELFTNNSVPILDILAEKLGVTSGAIFDMARTGKISFTDLQEAIALVTDEGGRFAGALLAQSQTLNGLISTIQGQATQTFQRLGTKILPIAKAGAEGLVNAFNDILESVDSFDIASDRSIAFAATIKSAFESAGTEIQLFVLDVKKTFLGLTEFFQRQATALANTKLGDVLFSDEDIQNSNANLKEVRDALFETERRIFELEQSGKRFGDSYKRNLEEVRKAFEQAGDAVNDFGDDTEDAGKKIEETFRKVEEVAKLATFGSKQFDTFDLSGPRSQREISPLESLSAPARDESIRASNTELNNQQQQLVNLQAAWENLGAVGQEVALGAIAGFEQLGAAFGNIIGGVVTGTLSLSDAWGSVKAAIGGFIKAILVDLLKLLARTLAIALLLQALGFGAASLGKTIKGILSGGIKVPFLADGGLVTSPTVAVIGEAGPEVVIPLDKLAKFGGVQTVQVTGRIDGNDIVLLQERGSENRLRRAGF